MGAVEPQPGRGAGLRGKPSLLDDHTSNVARLRRAAVIAVVTWPLFGLVDWFIVTYVAPGRLWFYLTLRAIGLLAMLMGVILIFGRKQPSERTVAFVDLFVSSAATSLITISCIEYGGIASPLAMGVVTVLLCRSIIFAHHWQKGIVPVGTIVLLYPLTLLSMAGFSPYIAHQFSDSRAVASFILNLMFVAAAGAIVVAGGHLIWSLRRQVYNSRSLGRYRLKRRIGAGGMGEVWLAHHDSLRRDVAVKILRPESAADDKAIARFEREVRATSELYHPNTVRVFDYGVTHDGLFYYAMELLEGHDLYDLVAKSGPMAAERAVRIISQAARALAEAHARGIIHRDIKPENLYLTNIAGEGDFVKVLDFGLAKVMAPDAGDVSLTQVGWAVGTPQWVSPEIVLGREADARSDIYGLGAVLYFLLCAQAPFNFQSMQRIMHAHMHSSPKPPSARLGRSVPAGLEAVVMRCISKDPKDRYQNALELSHALEECLSQHPRTFEIDDHFAQLGHTTPADRSLSPELRSPVRAAAPRGFEKDNLWAHDMRRATDLGDTPDRSGSEAKKGETFGEPPAVGSYRRGQS